LTRLGRHYDVDIDELVGALQAQIGRALTSSERTRLVRHFGDVLESADAQAMRPPSLERRIGPARYIAVGDLGAAALALFLGPVTHLLGAGATVASLRRFLKLDREWRIRVVSIYVRLSGNEARVFEEVHNLATGIGVADYDALREGDYARAFGRTAPTLSEVVKGLQGELDADAVAAVILGLGRRGILRSDGDRVWIRY
jgi:hypothetical protein